MQNINFDFTSKLANTSVMESIQHLSETYTQMVSGVL